MEEKINTAKIIVNESHELTDIVREIHKNKAERVVLTFTEHTDLLISPINLQVLQEAADRESKLLIAQIIQNPTGLRNSKLAGVKAIDTPANPTESDWGEAVEILQERKKEKVVKKKEIAKVVEPVDEKKDFESKVNNELEKPAPEKSKYVDRRGIKTSASFISIDGDLPQRNEQEAKTDDIPIRVVPQDPGRKSSKFSGLILRIKSLGKKKLIKLAMLILIPLFVLIGVGFLLFNQFATLAQVKVFIESKPIEIEAILTGDEKIEEIDFENLKIAIKTEEVTESLSDSVNATGKAYRVEKAKGSARLTYMLDVCTSDTPKLVLSAGHTISTSKYSFKLVNAVEVVCNNMADIQLIAADIGEEYNILASQKFSVQGYSSDEVFALNLEAFTGGTKEEYSVLSQVDVDNAVEQLSTTAIEEVKSELREITGGWEIIEDTIKSEVDKASIKTDKQVGAEATTVNLDLTIKGTATYYLTDGLTELLTDLLREKGEDDNLFESEKDLELVLGDNIEKTITVEESKNGVVKIKIVAKSSIKPKIDKEQITQDLKGMKWEDGNKYLENLKFADRDVEVTFQPNNYPEFLKRFPNRRGGILVTIIELEKQD